MRPMDRTLTDEAFTTSHYTNIVVVVINSINRHITVTIYHEIGHLFGKTNKLEYMHSDVSKYVFMKSDIAQKFSKPSKN